jgi:diadenosine tetraphosphatase ApaH/serine/threonine PP2A family protein phosphatase
VRYLVISDIHGNLEALEACLAAAATPGYDDVLVLGDVVGYGPDPNAVIERVQGLSPRVLIRGNHDKVASGVDDAEGFNTVARNAIRWAIGELTPEHRDWLAALPSGPVQVDDLVEVCHGTPHDEDAYVFDELDALKALESTSRPLCLFGHTHVPVVYTSCPHVRLGLTAPEGQEELTVALESGCRYLVNAGAVGQPRDGDPRAGFGIVDTAAATITLHRVEYPVEIVQQKVRRAGLPEMLARRLAVGR